MVSLRPEHRWTGPLLAAGLLAWAALATGAETVRIVGLQSVSEEEAESWISTQLEFIASSGVSMARADDVAYFLENSLRDRGFKEATVDWDLIGQGQGQVIVLTVSEGQTVRVGDIGISGNESLEDDAVVELLLSETRKRIKHGDPIDLPYVAADIQAGKQRIDEFYNLLGFNSAAVAVETTFASGYANLQVSIEEGRQSQVGEIALPEAPSKLITEKYEKILEDFQGKSYSGAIPENLETRLRAAAVNAGYYHSTIHAAPSAPQPVNGFDQIDIVVTADWGEQVRIGSISVEGNEKVNDRFFEKHFGELVGEPYSPETTNASVEELLQTGAFETVRTDLVDSKDGTAHLDIEVEEGYSRTLGVYGGFATYEGALGGFEFRNLNLFGSVRKIDAEVELSRRGARGEIEYIDPWFLDSDFEFRSALFAINRMEEGYEKFQTGGRYEFTRKLGREKRNAVAFFGEASYTDVHEADITPIFLGERTYLTHFAGISLSHDRRDNPRAPRNGFFAQTSLGVASSAIASETEFFKATGKLGYYLPIKDHTLRLGARAGMISPIGDQTAIPIDLRFFNGGAHSVRSFPERELGPSDPFTGYPIGGEFYTVFNVEYEIPLPMVDGLSFVPFADAGNLLFDADDAGLDDLRYAIGAGFRYRTPIGPLRVEYGFNPDQQPGEPEGAFHVGFGFAY